jgi:hypothetical protein
MNRGRSLMMAISTRNSRSESVGWASAASAAGRVPPGAGGASVVPSRVRLRLAVSAHVRHEAGTGTHASAQLATLG